MVDAHPILQRTVFIAHVVVHAVLPLGLFYDNWCEVAAIGRGLLAPGDSEVGLEWYLEMLPRSLVYLTLCNFIMSYVLQNVPLVPRNAHTWETMLSKVMLFWRMLWRAYMPLGFIIFAGYLLFLEMGTMEYIMRLIVIVLVTVHLEMCFVVPWEPVSFRRVSAPPELRTIERKNLRTLHYTGLGGDGRKAVVYAGRDGVLMPDGKRLTGHADLPMLLPDVRACTPGDVTYRLPETMWDYWILPGLLAVLLMRGVADIVHTLLGIDSLDTPFVLRSRFNVAQQGDVDAFLAFVEREMAGNEEVKFILHGCSRGASTVLAALPRLTPKQLKRIAFVVAEGGFDTVDHVLSYRYYFAAPLVRWILRVFTGWQPDAPSPLQVIKEKYGPLLENVPILLIVSRKDESVPPAATQNLHDAIRATRNGKLHLGKLQYATHSSYAFHNLDDMRQYHALVTEMIRKYA